MNLVIPSIKKSENLVRLFVCGDVMLGRGVDQALDHKVEPTLYEGFVKDARDYLRLAERRNGPLPRNRPVHYVWGQALDVLQAMEPDLRIINLETAITDRGVPWVDKGIHYRMHPLNVNVIKAAKVDCCVLSNNHVLDWGYDGLTDTMKTLRSAGIAYAGVGENWSLASSPVVFNLPAGGRLLIFGVGCPSSGVPHPWRAGQDRPGLWYVDSQSSKQVQEVQEAIAGHKHPGDVVVLSVHWGGNWGWDLGEKSLDFAKKMIDAGVDLVHGHSSHHIRPVSMHRGRLIMHGCGDFISDYEGIANPLSQGFRDDVSFMYFVDLKTTDGSLQDLFLVPMSLKKLSLLRASESDASWLYVNMQAQCRKFGMDLEKKSSEIYRLKLM